MRGLLLTYVVVKAVFVVVTFAPHNMQIAMGKLFIYLALAKPALPGQFELLVSSQS
jgi:hypothetical protein